MELTFRETPVESSVPCLTIFNGIHPVATIVTTYGPNEAEHALARRFCATDKMLEALEYVLQWGEREHRYTTQWAATYGPIVRAAIKAATSESPESQVSWVRSNV